MAEIVNGLFGIDPTQYQQQQQIQQANSNMQLAQLDPLQARKYSLMQAGTNIGNVGMNMLGIQDPMLQKATMAKQLAGQFDLTTSDGLKQYAQALAQQGAPDLAQMAFARSQEVESKSLVNEKAKLSLEQEKGMREALAALPADATDEDYLAVYRKFGGANALGTAIERSMAVKDRISMKQAETDRINSEVKTELLGTALEGKDMITNLKARVGHNTVGPVAAALSHLPYTDAASFSSDLKTLQSKLDTAVIAAMKAQSKTGATGFGAMNKQELDVIKKNIADLDATKLSPEDFNKKLETINRFFLKLEQKAQGTYNPREPSAPDQTVGGEDPLNLRKK